MAKPKRTKRGQKTHDEKLLKRVKADRKPGVTVLADLPDMKKPPKLRGHIPDKAVKRGRKIIKIEEIETLQTLEKDKSQQSSQKGGRSKRRNL